MSMIKMLHYERHAEKDVISSLCKHPVYTYLMSKSPAHRSSPGKHRKLIKPVSGYKKHCNFIDVPRLTLSYFIYIGRLIALAKL